MILRLLLSRGVQHLKVTPIEECSILGLLLLESAAFLGLLLLVARWVADDEASGTHWHRAAFAGLRSGQVAFVRQVPRHAPVELAYCTVTG